MGGLCPPALAFSSFCKNNDCASDHCRRPGGSAAAAPLLWPGPCPLPPCGPCPAPPPCHRRHEPAWRTGLCVPPPTPPCHSRCRASVMIVRETLLKSRDVGKMIKPTNLRLLPRVHSGCVRVGLLPSFLSCNWFSLAPRSPQQKGLPKLTPSPGLRDGCVRAQRTRHSGFMRRRQQRLYFLGGVCTPGVVSEPRAASLSLR